MRTNYLLATACATALWASSAWSAAAEDAAPPKVEAEGETVTVIAKNAPLRDVLDQLQAEAGFALIESSDLLQRPVTIVLEAVPWRDGLGKLLRGFRYALAMNPETNQPDRLVILSSDGSATRSSSSHGVTETAAAVSDDDTARQAADRGEASLEEATRIADELAAQREDPLQYALRQAREAAAEAQAAQEAAEKEQARRAAEGDDVAGSDDGPQDAYTAYADSLRVLGQFQDAERLDVLAPALSSTSKEVRSAALEALRDGTVSDSDTVLGEVRSMATGDADPYVRRDALEVFVRYGDQSDVLSLVQSLGRTDGPTRDIAVREWLRIEKERADAPLADEQLRQAAR